MNEVQDHLQQKEEELVKFILGAGTRAKLPELFLKTCELFLKGSYTVAKVGTEITVNTARKTAGEKGVGHKNLKRLTATGESLEHRTIAGAELRGKLGFERTARKYGLNYELVLNKGGPESTWEVFFKKKDMAVLEKAFTEHGYNQLSKTRSSTKKPTYENLISKYTKKFTELGQQNKEKNHSKGGIEL